jgi:hypothetical protein
MKVVARVLELRYRQPKASTFRNMLYDDFQPGVSLLERSLTTPHR